MADARAELQQACATLDKSDPNELFCYEKLGRIDLRENDAATARAMFTKGISAARLIGSDDPVVADLFLGMGDSLAVEKNKEYAEKFYQRGLEHNPSPAARAKLTRALQELRAETGTGQPAFPTLSSPTVPGN